MTKYIFLILALLWVTPARADITTGLVGWWKLDGNAIDSSSGGNNGTITGATATTDRFSRANMALSFNGTGDYITASNVLFGNTQFTMSGWVKKFAAGSQISFGVINGAFERAEIVFYTNGSLYGEVGPSHNVYGFHAATNDTNWHLITFVFDGSGATNADRVTLYFDGSILTPLTFSGTIETSVTCSNAFVIGTRNTGYSQGSIDDVRIYNRALSSTEVTELYQYRISSIGAGRISNARMGN